jgi:hypothetical protein
MLITLHLNHHTPPQKSGSIGPYITTVVEPIEVQNNIAIDLPIVIDPLRHKITFDYPFR